MVQVNELFCLLVQVESKVVLENFDVILEVEGIDGVFIGLVDFFVLLGYFDNVGYLEVQWIIEVCIYCICVVGKVVGFLVVDLVMVQKCLVWGVNFVVVGVDMMFYIEVLDSRLVMFKFVQLVSMVKCSY